MRSLRFYRNEDGNYLNLEFVLYLYKEQSSYDNLFSVNALILNNEFPIAIFKDKKEDEATKLLDNLMNQYNDLGMTSDEYIIKTIEKKIKFEIRLKFIIDEERYPTKEEYEDHFNKFISLVKLDLNDYDLGKFEEVYGK